ncbi:MAG TPA: SPOR domain-containing protein [Bacteroidales bacterium]|nr:SPOR domain-containing protein [Bacteroidales bacterium]HOK97878.1 SPOR domain-containing protein [Bacteroidales bacterium]HPO64643.1 SPOR domain-containing protein [Bacteroidales bacterium]
MKIFLSWFGVFITTLVFAQNSETSSHQVNIFSTLMQPFPQQGKVSIHQDKSIEQLMLRYVAYRNTFTQLSGYRIRIFSASGSSARTRAYAERDRFASLYPRYPIYLEYEAPNFKVYIGDFRNRHEAFRVFKQVSVDFKNAFIVPANINLPKID